ncbi:hypothetical protein A2617_02725 [Candidatus Daviesbacteria bacterium RIFOXYD1_FULL_41_10]|uniref:Uncharacterized protein n=2 Tax=Candidatus Daviesiibacteriota TaxID=1752718 RepID=A0A1F5N1R2_9BACT|nr:MAG: hypothetical protein UU67_C0029G0005 [Candidatus Daviesbacteria bacterium GW2011_GWB1_41_5]OGE71513.1 MAG: hypothetical protein A2617_02725 [Candidatus Daviesbacteria bacterium RIFOXYD1_FULL_41_10]
MNKLWNFKGFILAFEMTFFICFFSGIFWNMRLERSNYPHLYNEKSWYYLNRGLPVPWSGVSLAGRSVDFPIIKAPFIEKSGSFDDPTKFNKIIALNVFIPLFTILFLISYIFMFIFGRASNENKSLNKIVYPAIFILFFFCIFIYFFWFPRI